jgi:enolase
LDRNRLTPEVLIDSFEDFARLTARIPQAIIVGDDLYVTNIKRLEKGIKMHATNALLLDRKSVV